MPSLKLATRRLALTGLVATTAGAAACAIGTQQELEMGQQYAAEINRQLPIVDDPQVVSYINVLGDRLARQGPRGLQYHFYIVNTDVVNAFAVPGGHVYVNRGLIERTDNLSELAGVVAHEIAHVELRHGVEQMEKLQRAQIGLVAASILLGQPGPLAEAGVNIAAQLYFAQHGRSAEREADDMAIPLMVGAGIHPGGLVTFFKELLDERQREPTQLEQWFSTHPVTEDRIADTRAQIESIPASRLANLAVSTNEYASMKARLRQYPPPPPEFRQR